jgi:DNA polymerase-1
MRPGEPAAGDPTSSDAREPAPVLLFDGFSLLYRAFFALPAMNTAAGEPTSALYGLATVVLKLLRQERATAAVFALDEGGPSLRKAAFAGYKGSRLAAPTPLGRQVRRLRELIAAFGFPCYSAPSYEADDVLATLAGELRAAGQGAVVVTGDLDLLQCAGGPVRVHVVGRGVEGRTYDEAAVWARFGVAPAELPDWKALAGDVSDEIPGVPGVGGKTATALVRKFGNVSALLARAQEIEPAKLRGAILAQADSLPIWRELARLHADVPLPAGPRWAWFDDPARQRTRAWFEALEFRSLIPRLDALAVKSSPVTG